ncbi:hypothetical protein [Acinetobacter gerneri]|uniref:hypothetical protein n=1 Tax=Acinetobacter gerneri TaxID=202952 RepID=UPI003211F9FD
MNNKYELCVLQQIYLFLMERPNFLNTGEFDKIHAFFAACHEGDLSSFRFTPPFKFSGQFGKKKEISIKLAPKFTNKDGFLKWCENILN